MRVVEGVQAVAFSGSKDDCRAVSGAQCVCCLEPFQDLKLEMDQLTREEADSGSAISGGCSRESRPIPLADGASHGRVRSEKISHMSKNLTRLPGSGRVWSSSIAAHEMVLIWIIAERTSSRDEFHAAS